MHKRVKNECKFCGTGTYCGRCHKRGRKRGGECPHCLNGAHSSASNNNRCLLVHNPCILFCQYPRAVLSSTDVIKDMIEQSHLKKEAILCD